MNILHAVVLGIVEGVTEFLPISSTAHLTIVEKMLGYQIDEKGITAFTAVVQVGAIAAAIIYFWPDIARVATAWFQGLFDETKRKHDYMYGWAILAGSVPIAVVGLAFKDMIETTFRNLWYVAIALIVWSVVMWWADRTAIQRRKESQVTWRDTLNIGLAQCLAVIPGVSRSGATMVAGLAQGFNRTTVTRLSFFLGIPALAAAGVLQAASHAKEIAHGPGWLATIVGIVVSFGVAYYSIDWLLKFVAKHDFRVFIWYRIGIGTLIAILLITGVVSAV